MESNNNENDKSIKSKYESINSWLDEEDSKYSKNKDYSIPKKLLTNNDDKIEKQASKKDILSNINKLIEENDKKDQYIISNDQSQISKETEFNDNLKNINTSEVLGLSLELTEIKKTNKIMKETIQDLRNELSSNELKYKEKLSEELKKQKFTYTQEIDNLKELIKNLISEKKNLDNIINEKNGEIALIESKYKNMINDLKEQHKIEIEKCKDAWFIAEKNMRKKWKEDKIKEIKEMTIKNLEPELDNILQNHKSELILKEQELNDNFREQKEKLIISYENKIENMKKNFAKEKEEIQEKERKEYIKRLREQNIRMEDQHNSEQKKWYTSLQDEIKRLEELRNKDKKNYENDLNKITNKYNQFMEEKQKYWEDNRDKLNDQFKKRLEEEKQKIIDEKNQEIEKIKNMNK